MIDEKILIEKLNKLKWEKVDEELVDDDDGFLDGEEIYYAGRKQGRYEAFVRVIKIIKEMCEK